MGSRAGGRNAQEVTEVADHIFLLALDVARESSTLNLAATIIRRRLWLNAMGITEKSLLYQWLHHPTGPDEPGLLGVTPENLATFKEDQKWESRDASNHDSCVSSVLRPPRLEFKL